MKLYTETVAPIFRTLSNTPCSEENTLCVVSHFMERPTWQGTEMFSGQQIASENLRPANSQVSDLRRGFPSQAFTTTVLLDNLVKAL